MLNKIILISVTIFFLYTNNYAINQTPENIYSGYGYVAGVNNIVSATVNPANLYVLNNDEIYVTFIKPLEFHSLTFGFPLSAKYYLGLAIIDNPYFRQYRLSTSILNARHYKIGAGIGIDQEMSPYESDEIGFCFSPGLTVLLYDAPEYNFSSTFGLNFKNLLSINQFDTSEIYTKHNIDLGLRLEIFIPELFLNLGGNYFNQQFNYSVSLEYPISDFINMGLVIKDQDKFGLGTTINFLNNYLGFSYMDRTYSISYSLTLNDLVEVQTQNKVRRSSRYIKAVKQETLNQQRIFLNEGIKLYKEKKYEEARTSWRKVIRLAPNTEQAKEAKNYINKVNNILKSVGE